MFGIKGLPNCLWMRDRISITVSAFEQRLISRNLGAFYYS